MQLIRGRLRLTKRLPKSVVTIGNFDGFHLGHQQLIKALRKQSIEFQAPTGIMTFEPQPIEFFNPNATRPRLMRLREKWRFLKDQSIDYLICLNFDKKLALYGAPEFVEKILVEQLGVSAVVVGDDFRFGASRSGDIELLQTMGARFGFKVVTIPPLMVDEKRVSSTLVRKAILENNLNLATKLLGRPYFLCGKVIHGDARGRQWGFPTANIHLAGKKICVSGIYIVRVFGIAKTPLPGVASVGIRPMFVNGRVLLEVHLLDFNADIYGRELLIEFLYKLRDEQLFAETGQLVEQIRLDVKNTKDYFASTIQTKMREL